MASPSASERRSFTYARCDLYGSARIRPGGFCRSRPAGWPQRGQSHVSGGATSAAKRTTESWPAAQKYVTSRRGAGSLRSSGRIGLEPMRLARIALPLDTNVTPVGTGRETGVITAETEPRDPGNRTARQSLRLLSRLRKAD